MVRALAGWKPTPRPRGPWSPSPRPSPTVTRVLLLGSRLVGEGARAAFAAGAETVPLQWLAWSTRARRVVRPNGPSIRPARFIGPGELLQKMPSEQIDLCGRASVRIVTGLRPHGKTAEAPYSRSGIGRGFLDRRVENLRCFSRCALGALPDRIFLRDNQG